MITIFHRIRIDFAYPEQKRVYDPLLTERLDTELLGITTAADHAEIFTGNAACGPYIIAEYSDATIAACTERLLLCHLKKRKVKVLK